MGDVVALDVKVLPPFFSFSSQERGGEDRARTKKKENPSYNR